MTVHVVSYCQRYEVIIFITLWYAVGIYSDISRTLLHCQHVE